MNLHILSGPVYFSDYDYRVNRAKPSEVLGRNLKSKGSRQLGY
jgi:hypothetical protein